MKCNTVQMIYLAEKCGQVHRHIHLKIHDFVLLLLFSHSVVFDSLRPYGLPAACQDSLSITIFQSLLKPMSIESVMPSNHLILCHPSPPAFIFPTIRVFSNESNTPYTKPNTLTVTNVSLFYAPCSQRTVPAPLLSTVPESRKYLLNTF